MCLRKVYLALMAIRLVTLGVSFAFPVIWDYNGYINDLTSRFKSYKDGKEDNPDEYPSLYPQFCAGTHQSPIDINPRTAKNRNYPLLTFGNYGRVLSGWKVTNNGLTGLYSLSGSDQLPYIQDGGLSDKFLFAQFHFHWGGKGWDSTTTGSEHKLKSRQYPAEVHFVHYNSKYGSFSNATNYNDGLAVLGIFIQTGLRQNSAFDTLIDLENGVHTIELNDESYLNTPLALNGLLPWRTSSFFRYSGSLTTPKCNEIVTWTVFDDPLVVTRNQLTKLRSLFGATGEEPNVRPVQPINDRDVYYRSTFGVPCHLPSGWPLFTPSPINDFWWWTRCVTGF